MKHVFFLMLLGGIVLHGSSQPVSNNSDSCYAIKENDTTWKMQCIQVPPCYPGGDQGLFKFLRSNVMYPKLAKDIALQGKIFVTFVIDKAGNVTDAEIYKSNISTDHLKEKHLKYYEEAKKQLEDETLRVVHLMSAWSQGKENNKFVKVRYILPFSFKLQ